MIAPVALNATNLFKMKTPQSETYDKTSCYYDCIGFSDTNIGKLTKNKTKNRFSCVFCLLNNNQNKLIQKHTQKKKQYQHKNY